MDNLNIQYTYHVHSGNTTDGGGCYTQANMVTYQTGTTTVTEKCGSTSLYKDTHTGDNGVSYNGYRCSSCGKFYTSKPSTCTKTVQRQKPVYGTKQDGWLLGCGKTTETIESATIIF